MQKALRTVSAWNDGVQEAIFRPTPSGADIQRRRRWSSRRALTPITTSRTSSRSTAPPGNWSWPAASTTSGPGPRSRFISCPSRKSSSGTSASKAGITSGNGPARTCAIFCERVGADLTAKYVYFICADDYTESIDMAIGAASADHPRHQICRRHHRRSVRLSAAAAHLDQARLQERKMDQGDRSHQRFSRDVLEQAGL